VEIPSSSIRKHTRAYINIIGGEQGIVCTLIKMRKEDIPFSKKKHEANILPFSARESLAVSFFSASKMEYVSQPNL